MLWAKCCFNENANMLTITILTCWYEAGYRLFAIFTNLVQPVGMPTFTNRQKTNKGWGRSYVFGHPANSWEIVKWNPLDNKLDWQTDIATPRARPLACQKCSKTPRKASLNRIYHSLHDWLVGWSNRKKYRNIFSCTFQNTSYCWKLGGIAILYVFVHVE